MTPDRHIYQSIEPVEVEDAEAVLEQNNPDELLLVAISVGMHAEDLPWAEAFCLRLAKHSHFNVRANAVLSFGHLARRFKTLTRPESIDAVRSGLTDADEYVRRQAEAAADDVEWFAKLKVRP